MASTNSHQDSEEEKQRFRDDPEYYLKYRKSVEVEMVRAFSMFHKNSPESMAALKVCSIHTPAQLHTDPP